MKLNLAELLLAAERFKEYTEALVQAPHDVVANERLKLGVRNARNFSFKSEQLGVLANAVSRAQFAAPPSPGGSVEESSPLLSLDFARQEVAFGDNDLPGVYTARAVASRASWLMKPSRTVKTASPNRAAIGSVPRVSRSRAAACSITSSAAATS
mgnify:CR=1 FL=1